MIEDSSDRFRRNTFKARSIVLSQAASALPAVWTELGSYVQTAEATGETPSSASYGYVELKPITSAITNGPASAFGHREAAAILLFNVFFLANASESLQVQQELQRSQDAVRATARLAGYDVIPMYAGYIDYDLERDERRLLEALHGPTAAKRLQPLLAAASRSLVTRQPRKADPIALCTGNACAGDRPDADLGTSTCAFNLATHQCQWHLQRP